MNPLIGRCSPNWSLFVYLAMEEFSRSSTLEDSSSEIMALDKLICRGIIMGDISSYVKEGPVE